jgi:hypothetical protein
MSIKHIIGNNVELKVSKVTETKIGSLSLAVKAEDASTLAHVVCGRNTLGMPIVSLDNADKLTDNNVFIGSSVLFDESKVIVKHEDSVVIPFTAIVAVLN